jgi:hypothetical protein
MKKIVKYLPLVIAVSAIADTQFDLLISLGLKENVVNYIKLFGLLLTAFLPSIKELVKEEEEVKSIKSNDAQIGKRPKRKGELDGDDDSMV